ncbi:MAG: hypothetical protein KGL69_00905, partial [Alphaproteobacteria bacterium]|nr:hypothetical protein [Alphaproteobacteria bacterium]
APPQGEGADGISAGPPPESIWRNWFKIQRLWSYVDRHSLVPGEPLNIMAAAGPGQPVRHVRAEVFRVGAHGVDAKVWTSDFVPVGYRGATRSAAATGPGWPPTFADIDTRDWPPGCYYADLVEQTTLTRDVKSCFWIVRNPKRSGAVLVRLGTNTYQAYNDWGGYSIYPNDDDENRGLMVTFDRPTPPSFWEYDVFLVNWIEALAEEVGGVDYATNFDVHAEPGLMDPYALVITGSHDEYWSKEEFDAFYRRIFTQGGNVAFFGGNTAYCQVRFVDINQAPGEPNLGRQMVCYKTASDPITRRGGKVDPRLLETSNFRTKARRPESMLLGGAYQNWFEPAGPQRPALNVASLDSPWFAGTGWSVGAPAADVVGYEWDNRDPDGDGQRLWKAGVSLIPAIDPARIKVLFRGEAEAEDGTHGLAESTLFRSGAGAQVFNAAVIRWSWGLGKPGYVSPAFQTFNANLVRDLSKRGPRRARRAKA